MDFQINGAELLQAWQGMVGRIEKQATNRDTLRQWRDNPQALCGELSAQLKSGAYRQAPLQAMGLPRKGGGVLLLLVPQLADRVVQAALARKLSAHLDTHFHPSSFAYRAGRGVQQACAHLRTHLNRSSERFVLHADISNCFDDIDHGAVISQALTGWGIRVQFSVFECSLLPRELRALQQQIDRIIDSEQDHVIVLQCAKPGWPRHRLLARTHDLSRDYWLA